MNEHTGLTQELIRQSIFYFNENTPRIKKSLDILDDHEIWKRPNDNSNSIGNLILHLCGNITQYVISALGSREDLRNRDGEFSTKEGFDKHQLFDKLSKTVAEATQILQSLTERDLLKMRMVQGTQLSGVGIIVHVVEHYSYHTGQIVFWTKLLKDKDLGFYAGRDLNIKNEQ